MRVEAAGSPVDVLDRAEPPRSEQRRDPGGPRPFAHSVESLPVLNLMAVGELLVAEDVAMGVDDAFRESRRSRRVIELCGIVCLGGAADLLCWSLDQGLSGEDQQRRCRAVLEPRRVLFIGDKQPRLGILKPVSNPVVAVENRHREKDRAELPDGKEDRSSLRCWRQHDSDAITSLYAPVRQDMRRLIRKVLQLAPGELARRAIEALPDHRRLVARMFLADILCDVVELGHLPAVLANDLLVSRH